MTKKRLVHESIDDVSIHNIVVEYLIKHNHTTMSKLKRHIIVFSILARLHHKGYVIDLSNWIISPYIPSNRSIEQGTRSDDYSQKLFPIKRYLNIFDNFEVAPDYDPTIFDIIEKEELYDIINIYELMTTREAVDTLPQSFKDKIDKREDINIKLDEKDLVEFNVYTKHQQIINGSKLRPNGYVYALDYDDSWDCSKTIEDIEELAEIMNCNTYLRGEMLPVSPDAFFSGHSIIFDMMDCATSDYGEHAENYLRGVTKEQELELEELISKWIIRNKLQPTFYDVVNIEEITIDKPLRVY